MLQAKRPRYEISVGVLFASVANAFIVSQYVPDNGVLTLADNVNAIGIIAILIVLIQSTISMYIYEQLENPAFARVFDRISVVLIAILYVVINVALPNAARL